MSDSVLGLLFEISADPSKALTATTSFRDQASAAIKEFEEKLLSSMTASLGITKEFAAGMGVATGIVVGLGAAALELANKAAEVGAKMYETSERTGISAEKLSGLNAISKVTGGSFDGLATALSRAGVNLQKAIDEPGTQSAEVLARVMGGAKNLTNLGLLPMADRLQAVLKHIFALNDVGERNLALQSLMGRGWQQNVESLKLLAEQGYGPAIEMAKKFGLYFDAESAQKAKEFTAQWDLAKAEFESLAAVLGQKLIPLMNTFMRNVVVDIEYFGQYAKVLALVTVGGSAAGLAFMKIAQHAKSMGDIMKENDALIEHLVPKTEDLAKGLGDVAKAAALDMSPLAQAIRQIAAQIDTIKTGNLTKEINGIVDGINKIATVSVTAEGPLAAYSGVAAKMFDIFKDGMGPMGHYATGLDGLIHFVPAATIALGNLGDALKGVKMDMDAGSIATDGFGKAASRADANWSQLYDMLRAHGTVLTQTTVDVKSQGVEWQNLSNLAVQALGEMEDSSKKHHATEVALHVAMDLLQAAESTAKGFAALGTGDDWAAAQYFLAAAGFAAAAGQGGGGGSAGGGSYGGSGGGGSFQGSAYNTPQVGATGTILPTSSQATTIHVISNDAAHAQLIAGLLNTGVRQQGLQLNATHNGQNVRLS